MAGKRNKKSDVPPPAVSWVTQLAEELNIPFPPKDAGWFTFSEIQRQINKGPTGTKTIISKLNLEKQNFMHIGIDGRRIIRVHYRLK
jgi:hypothetical protein